MLRASISDEDMRLLRRRMRLCFADDITIAEAAGVDVETVRAARTAPLPYRVKMKTYARIWAAMDAHCDWRDMGFNATGGGEERRHWKWDEEHAEEADWRVECEREEEDDDDE